MRKYYDGSCANVMGGRGGLNESGLDTENCRLPVNIVIRLLVA